MLAKQYSLLLLLEAAHELVQAVIAAVAAESSFWTAALWLQPTLVLWFVLAPVETSSI